MHLNINDHLSKNKLTVVYVDTHDIAIKCSKFTQAILDTTRQHLEQDYSAIVTISSCNSSAIPNQYPLHTLVLESCGYCNHKYIKHIDVSLQHTSPPWLQANNVYSIHDPSYKAFILEHIRSNQQVTQVSKQLKPVNIKSIYYPHLDITKSNHFHDAVFDSINYVTDVYLEQFNPNASIDIINTNGFHHTQTELVPLTTQCMFRRFVSPSQGIYINYDNSIHKSDVKVPHVINLLLDDLINLDLKHTSSDNQGLVNTPHRFTHASVISAYYKLVRSDPSWSLNVLHKSDVLKQLGMNEEFKSLAIKSSSNRIITDLIVKLFVLSNKGGVIVSGNSYPSKLMPNWLLDVEMFVSFRDEGQSLELCYDVIGLSDVVPNDALAFVLQMIREYENDAEMIETMIKLKPNVIVYPSRFFQLSSQVAQASNLFMRNLIAVDNCLVNN